MPPDASRKNRKTSLRHVIRPAPARDDRPPLRGQRRPRNALLTELDRLSGLSECLRVDELVARRGGDEFVVVLNDADSQYTDAVVRRIDDAIVKARRRICQDLRPSASVTSVSWRPGDGPEKLLREIDIALHGKEG